MYAVDDLKDAIGVTKEFLTPIRLGTWLKLALIVFFIGGATVGAPMAPPFDAGAGADASTTEGAFEDALNEAGLEMGEFILGVLIIAAFLFVLWLGYVAIASILEFVFIESLRSSSVHVRQYTNENVGKGLRLFLFRIGLVILFGGPTAALIALGVLYGPSDATLLSIMILGGVLALTFGLAFAIVNRFTTVFVAPIMLLEDRGVIDAWRRFWPTLTGNGAEYAVYLVLIWIVQLVVGIAFVFLAGIIVTVLAIPFVILMVVFFFLGDIGLILAVLTAIVGVLVVAAAVMFLRVPIESYFFYYALLVLGDTNPELDLIPDQRAAVRGDGGVPFAGETDRRDPWDNGSSSDESDRAVDDGVDNGGFDGVGDDDRDGGDDGWDETGGWDDSSSWDEQDSEEDDDDDDDRDDTRGW